MKYEKEIKLIERLYEMNKIIPTIERVIYKDSWSDTPLRIGGIPIKSVINEYCKVEELVKEKGLEEVLKELSQKILDKGIR